MCGIIGLFNIHDESAMRSEALKMVRKIRHRGPDWSGSYSDENCVLMHERLSIVDVEHGAQPLYDTKTKRVLAVNGEIYNHNILAKKLKQPHNWQTNSDALDSYVIINTAVDGDFIQYEEDVIFATAYRSGSYGVCESWVALYDYDWEMIRWLDDYTSASWVGPGSNYSNQCTAANLENKFVQSNTEIPYIYYIIRSDSNPGLHVMNGDTFTDVHIYKTDLEEAWGVSWSKKGKIFYNSGER